MTLAELCYQPRVWRVFPPYRALRVRGALFGITRKLVSVVYLFLVAYSKG